MAFNILELNLKISQIIEETPETKTFRFDISKNPIDFKPGQFMMLNLNIPGNGQVLRPYSISSSPLDRFLDITVKKVDNGIASAYMFTQLKVGDSIKMKGPYGVFTLSENASRLVFIGAGSGIAPFRSMWRYILQKKLPVNLTVIFSSRIRDYIIFRKELEEINKSGIRAVHTLTRNQDPSWTGYSRRIDKQMLAEILGDFKDSLFYVCGPPPMCLATVEVLKELGVEEGMIKMEKFD